MDMSIFCNDISYIADIVKGYNHMVIDDYCIGCRPVIKIIGLIRNEKGEIGALLPVGGHSISGVYIDENNIPHLSRTIIGGIAYTNLDIIEYNSHNYKGGKITHIVYFNDIEG